MPNNVRPDLLPSEVHPLPKHVFASKTEAEVLSSLWEDIGDPDFPLSTAAVVNMQPAKRRAAR